MPDIEVLTQPFGTLPYLGYMVLKITSLKHESMKSIFPRISVFILLVTLAWVGCKKDDKFVEKEFLKFSDFECDNGLWRLKPNYVGHNYIISTLPELQEHVLSDCIPTIDFTKYVVLIGIKSFTTGASLYGEKVEESETEIVYTVTFDAYMTTVVMGVPYHVVIEKPKDSDHKNIRIVELIKN